VRSRDINYNGAVMAFVAHDASTAVENIKSLMTVLKEEGIEALGVDCRPLDWDEAVYVNSRVMNLQENSKHGLGAKIGLTTIRADAGEGTAGIDNHGKRDTIMTQKNMHTREAMREADEIREKRAKAEIERQRTIAYYGGT